MNLVNPFIVAYNRFNFSFIRVFVQFFVGNSRLWLHERIIYCVYVCNKKEERERDRDYLHSFIFVCHQIL